MVGFSTHSTFLRQQREKVRRGTDPWVEIETREWRRLDRGIQIKFRVNFLAYFLFSLGYPPPPPPPKKMHRPTRTAYMQLLPPPPSLLGCTFRP
jgi:hypothetical protein